MTHLVLDLENIASATVFEIFGYELSVLELFATITSLIGVSLGVVGARITWPWWVSGSVLYGILFWQWQLYASALLQVIFIVAGIWGWFGWGPQGAKPAKLTLANRLTWVALMCIGWLGLTPLFTSIGAAATSLDTLILVGSFVAQVLMVLEKFESWIIWVLVDVVGTVHYFRQDLWFTSVLYAVFTVVAVFGLRRWLNNVNQSHT